MTLRKLCTGMLFLASASLVFGQTDSSSLTVTASRSNSQQPDQVVFAVSLASPLNTTLDDVVAALAGSGITAADLFAVRSSQMPSSDGTQTCVPDLQWTFTLAVPFSNMKDATSMLTALQQKIGQKIPAFTMDFHVQGVRVSPQLNAAQQCPIPDLVADARTEAQKLANAAGASVGPILALSDGSSNTAPGLGLVTYYEAIALPAVTCGNATTNGTILSAVPNAIANPASCAVVVKFSLLRP